MRGRTAQVHRPGRAAACGPSLNLSPLAACGKPPHPNPLPASGEREKKATSDSPAAPGGGEAHTSLPGRTCPLDYRYDPAVFARPADFAAQTLYVVGGLYGNLAAAHAIEQLAAAERRPVTIVYNGDFHWFDASDYWFDAVEQAVAPHRALRGNVETEIVRAGDVGAGCGCAYPAWIDDGVVARSNAILGELRLVAARAPSACARLAGLPMHLVASVGDLRIGIVHGDATSLAGWGFTREALAGTSASGDLSDLRAGSRIDVFASTHTCVALLHDVTLPAGRLTVINNGAAGMPNFAGARQGLISRIATMPSPHRALYGVARDGVHVDAIAVPYDHDRFYDRFVARWPAGSAAHLSYAQRILGGPNHVIAQAVSPPSLPSPACGGG
jgi:hypothetical protein